MGDIGGARIALARSDNRSTGKLFDYLIRFFKKYHDHFELVQIENYRLKDWSYASSSSLDRLSKISTHPNQQLVEKYHPVGYPAIHLEVYDKIADATYEIQIMGQDVEKFKEIEDIKYKVIGCKSILPEQIKRHS